ncbi:MAG: dihydrolipoyl dehydrogenase [Alphaproteobacteria bacterium]|nr:dihydrolipoyl dehydrogenase [Alphaproteobacteria bacterium]
MARTYHVFDVVIIGAGSAGISALREALKYTSNVVLVEKGEGGTTCAKTGCMPSKALIHAAKLYDSRKKFKEVGINGAEHLQADVPRILKKVREHRDHFVSSVKEGLESIDHYIVRGVAKFESPTCLRVDDKLYHTHRTIIATGSVPFIPKDFSAIPKERIITSETLFELKDLPKRIGMVGLGPLGLEMAQAIAKLDISVVAAHANTLLGGISDADMNHEMQHVLAKNMKIHTNADASAEMKGNNIIFTVDGENYPVDALFLSAGRKPAIEALGLRKLKVPMKDSGVPWFDPMTLQLPNLPIFMAGDVNDERAILHEASLEGKTAAYNAVHHHGNGTQMDDDTNKATKKSKEKNGKRPTRYVPMNIIFTEPNIASVGASYDCLKGRKMIEVEASFENQGRAVVEQRNVGRIRLFLDADDCTLLGAELLAPEGEHIVHLLALAIQQHMTATDLLKMPFYHPTFEEALRTALKRGVEKWSA